MASFQYDVVKQETYIWKLEYISSIDRQFRSVPTRYTSTAQISTMSILGKHEPQAATRFNNTHFSHSAAGALDSLSDLESCI